MKRSSLLATLAVGLAGIFIGALLLVSPVDLLIKIFFTAFGVLTLISGIPQLVFSISNMGERPKEAVFDMILAIITIMFGLVLLFIQSMTVMLIVGGYLVIFPFIRVILASEKTVQFKKELPSIILGIVMIVVGPGKAIKALFDVAGIVFIVLAFVYMTVGIIVLLKKSKNTTDAVIYVESKELPLGSDKKTD